jgi:hypothetical protein
LIANQELYTKVKELAEGTPNYVGEDGKEHSFYSVEYGKVSDKKIFKICRDKFFAKDDFVYLDSSGKSKKSVLRVDPDIVNGVRSLM